MLRIDNNIISLDILEKKFSCNLAECHGCCCRYGDSGAPLMPEEVIILKEIQPIILPYLNDAGKKALAEKGTSIIDFEGDNVTPLVGNEECAYAYVESGIFLCGIERAWRDGKISFRKPLSCHLFPIRIKQYTDFLAINYQEWALCNSARQKGKSEGVYVYEFLKEPLIRALGEDVYSQICTAAEEIRKNPAGLPRSH